MMLYACSPCCTPDADGFVAYAALWLSNADERIQETLRNEVQRHGITMMTIAHRINTILTSDKVIVMDAGRVAEYGNTTELANDKTSTFSTFL